MQGGGKPSTKHLEDIQYGSPLSNFAFLYLRLSPKGVLVQRRESRGRGTGDGILLDRRLLLLCTDSSPANLAEQGLLVDAGLEEPDEGESAKVSTFY